MMEALSSVLGMETYRLLVTPQIDPGVLPSIVSGSVLVQLERRTVQLSVLAVTNWIPLYHVARISFSWAYGKLCPFIGL